MTSSDLPIIVYANGCSWTAGNGIDTDPALAHIPNLNKLQVWEDLSWPAKLAIKLGGKAINRAMGGGSNRRMVRITSDFVRKWPKEQRDRLLVVLGWTSCERNEVYVSYNGVSKWCMFNALQDFEHQWPRDSDIKDPAPWPKDVVHKISENQKTYVQYMVDEVECTERFLREVWMMANILENLGIKYLFFSSIHGIGFPYSKINPDEQFPTEMRYLQDKRFLEMDKGKTMLRYCKENNLPLSDCHHPMIQAHQSWADHLYNEYMRIYQDDHRTKDNHQAVG